MEEAKKKEQVGDLRINSAAAVTGSAIPSQMGMNQMVVQQRRNPYPENTIDLVELFFYMLGHWKPIVIALLVGAILAGTYHVVLIKPTYRADASIYITNKDSILSLADLQLSTALAEDYTNIVKSRAVLKEVIDEMGLNTSYERLKNCVAVENPKSTHIIKVYVYCGDMQLAQDIANTIVNVSVNQIYKIIGTGEPSVLDVAEADTIIETTPSLKRYVALGGMAGLALMGGWFMLLFLLDTTLKTEDDIEKYLHLPNLASIPYYEGASDKKKGKKKA